jgi:hypothetical protein
MFSIMAGTTTKYVYIIYRSLLKRKTNKQTTEERKKERKETRNYSAGFSTDDKSIIITTIYTKFI